MHNIALRLLNDTHHILNTDISSILLHKNALIPWLIVVPDTCETEFLLLDDSLQQSLLKQSSLCARYLLSAFSVTKINFAAIGNVVPQCHLHVVARSDTDSCWPLPVWGHLNDETHYTEQQIQQIKTDIKISFDAPD